MSPLVIDPVPWVGAAGRDVYVTYDLLEEPGGSPEDLGDVTAATFTYRRQVLANQTRPDALTATLAGGAIAITDGTVAVTLDKLVTASLPPGLYDFQIDLDRSGGRDEAVVRGQLQLLAGI